MRLAEWFPARYIDEFAMPKISHVKHLAAAAGDGGVKEEGPHGGGGQAQRLPGLL